MEPLGYDLVTFWLPLVGGLVSLTGVLAFWLQYSGHRKDRPRIIVEVTLRTRELFPPSADWEFRMVNTGRRPVTIRRPVFKLRRFKGRRLGFLNWTLPKHTHLVRDFLNPPRLDEQAAETRELYDIYSGPLDEELSFFPGDIVQVGVEDQSGKHRYAQKIKGIQDFLTIYSLKAVEEEQIGDLDCERGTYIGRFALNNRHYVIGLTSLSGRITEVHSTCDDEDAAVAVYRELLQEAATFRSNGGAALTFRRRSGCGSGGSGLRTKARVLHWLSFRKVKRHIEGPMIPVSNPDLPANPATPE